jgi:HPt (histidine-containing phosphotransfer) domain-containing protein
LRIDQTEAPVSDRKEYPAAVEVSFPNDEIDLSDLYHLANNDKPFVRLMLTQFIESTENGLKEILDFIEKSDLKKAADTAHKISAPCKHVGAKVLYDHLKSMEKYDGTNNGLLEMRKLYRVTKKEFDILKNILHTHLMKMSEQ